MRLILYCIILTILLAPSVFSASIAEAGGARLVASDSTESLPAGVSAPVQFYAQLTNISSGGLVNGSCNITVNNISNQFMTFNSSGDGRFNLSIASLVSGDSQFNITCWAEGLGPVTASDTASAKATSNLTLSATSTDAGQQAYFNATFVNSSNGAIITGASCIITFQTDAGEPRNPSMQFNTSTFRYETRRQFSKGGNISFNATCMDSHFDNGIAAGSVYIRQYLPNVSFFDSPPTTNFSAFSRLDNVEVVLANRHGSIRWISLVNATLRDFDSNVYLGSNFVSMNISALGSEYNSSIEVILYNAYSRTIVTAPGIFYLASQVRGYAIPCGYYTSPSCTEVSSVGSTVSFRASYPASFALGPDANISVWSNGSVPQWSTVTVFANYTNSSNNAPIHTASPYNGGCTVTFSSITGEPLNGIMSYESGSYKFSRQAEHSGSFDYNITCESDTFAYQQSSSYFTVTIAQAAVPQTPAPATPTPAFGPADSNQPASAEEPSPSKVLVATSTGLTTDINAGEEVDVSVIGVIVRAGIESINDGAAQARLGSQKGSLSQGQELLMDVDRDGVADISMKLLGITKDSAKVEIKKLRADDESQTIEDQSEEPKETPKNKPKPIEEPIEEKSGPSWWWFVFIFIVVLLIGKWYFQYNQRMKKGFI